jgi:tRNA pseudouridine55 synthase
MAGRARGFVLVVDKPSGPTSHDVVAKARRALGTRKVGHAGTLDPLASGVLVLLVGEGTKLGPYLTAHDKRYRARVAFGLSTDSLDRDGATVAAAPLPPWLNEELTAITAGRSTDAPRLAAAVAAEKARDLQIPPAYSAIKVDGQRSYARARAGEAVDLAPRGVAVRALEIAGASAASVDLTLDVTKGYYVRSLARDLGERLGVPAHLDALRRVASGPFSIDEAAPLGAMATAPALTLEAAVGRSLPIGRMSAEGAPRARQGKRLDAADFLELPPLAVPSAWLDEAGHLVAIGTRGTEGFVFHRGFAEEPGRGGAPTLSSDAEDSADDPLASPIAPVAPDLAPRVRFFPEE